MVVSKILRAKQFLPFDALKGLQEALREKEIEYKERVDLSDEILNELNNVFNKIELGSKIKIIYYKNRRYIQIKGTVTKIDYTKKKIQIDKKEDINISDIVKIEI